MRIVFDYARNITRIIERELETPGVMPVWTTPQSRDQVPADALALIEPLIANPASLVGTPPKDWIVELREAFRLGLVYLRDERSVVDPTAVIRAQRLIMRNTRLGPFCLVAGDHVLLRDSSLSSHGSIDGPSVIAESHFRQHVVLGPFVIITRSSSEPYVKVTRFVRVDKSLMASNSSIEGSTHPEQIPLGPNKRELGVRIGPFAWLGQHVSVTNGGIVGTGVVVATHTSITKRTGDWVFVMGNPPREFPIDFNIRGLSPDEAFAEGQKQGLSALHLPSFGVVNGAFATPTRLELDYPEHLFLRGLVSENTLHFQRGVLALTLAQLFPDHAATLELAVGGSVRFTAEFDKPLAAPLYVPGEFAPTLFRAGGDGGMFAYRVKPPMLAGLWTSLLRSATPLPPLQTQAPAPSNEAQPAVRDEELETIVAGMVAHLTSRAAPIDPEAPFHALGVDSLVGVQLAVAVEARFDLVAPDVFRHNSVRKLAQLIRQSR
jgi:acetyltransferase-like isoleucine patch superfamily enzyme/acyl carrier protein